MIVIIPSAPCLWTSHEYPVPRDIPSKSQYHATMDRISKANPIPTLGTEREATSHTNPHLSAVHQQQLILSIFPECTQSESSMNDQIHNESASLPVMSLACGPVFPTRRSSTLRRDDTAPAKRLRPHSPGARTTITITAGEMIYQRKKTTVPVCPCYSVKSTVCQ